VSLLKIAASAFFQYLKSLELGLENSTIHESDAQKQRLS
jgi:hypothetical protein